MLVTDLEVTHRRTRLWICLGLLAVTVAVYWPVTRFAFINFDDPDYVTQNNYVLSGVTWPGIVWAFTTAHSANWHPLTWLSHMLDVQIFGPHPGPHHLMNLIFHAANTLLLFLLFETMAGARWRSAFVAALFALHPLHVESVAWVSERKDVLSTFFGLLAIWAYAAYARKSGVQPSTASPLRSESPGPRVAGLPATHHAPRTTSPPNLQPPASSLQPPAWLNYLLSLCLFALSLMSKPMLVTLPFLLLLLDYWPLHRLQLQPPASSRQPLPRLVLEKLPFLALAALSSLITVLAQKQGQALLSVESLPLWPRLSNALVACLRYMGKLFWPSHLALPYPYPGGWPLALVLLALLALVGITVLALRWARSRPYVAVGWCWFLATLLPVIGLVQVGPQAMADRYTYIPLIGLFVLVTWLLADSLSRWRLGPTALTAAGVAVVALCLGLARMQAGYWKDSETLFRHSLAVTTGNYVAHDNLGDALAEQGKREPARAEFAAAITLKPDFAHPYSNIAKLAFNEGDFAAAADWFQKALQRRPRDPEIHSNLAAALASQGRADDAIAHYLEAIRLQPDRFQAHSDLARLLLAQGRLQPAVERGLAALCLSSNSAETHLVVANALFLQGKLESAAAHYQAGLKTAPNSPALRLGLGKALAGLRRFAEAEAQVTEALRLQPGSPDAHQVLAAICKSQNRFREARSEYEAALRHAPDWPEVLNNLAWLLATQPSAELRDGVKAVTLAERACQLTASTNLWFLSTLAAAYAEAGRFPDAVATQQKVCGLATTQEQTNLADRFQRRLDLYRSGQPFREP